MRGEGKSGVIWGEDCVIMTTSCAIRTHSVTIATQSICRVSAQRPMCGNLHEQTTQTEQEE